MAVSGITVPTTARLMRETEWAFVCKVFTADRLPWKERIILTDGAGVDGACFTMPTSLIPTVFGAALGALSFPPLAALMAGAGYIGSIVNVGYIMNLGAWCKHDMSKTRAGKCLLAHETMHVRQGRNSVFALTYVASSVVAQCKGMSRSGGTGGRAAAYDYEAGKPWGHYNAEQQAQLVEDWVECDMPELGPHWPYIRDTVRQGKTS